LDEVKSRESELNASPPTFTKNVMIHHVCVLLGKTTNKSFPPKNKKKHPLSFITSLVPSFSFPFPPFAQFRLKNRRKIEKYLRFGNGKEECRQNQARANKTRTRTKEKRTRANKKHTNACK
jgi:hypothetical protein